MITIELDVKTAAAVRQVLYKEQENYTLDKNLCPQRISDIREFVLNIDNKIENLLKDD